MRIWGGEIKKLTNARSFALEKSGAKSSPEDCGRFSLGRCSVYNRIAIIKERDNHGYNVLAFGKAETEWHNMGHFGDIRQARNRAGLVKFVLEKVVVSLKEVLGEVKL